MPIVTIVCAAWTARAVMAVRIANTVLGVPIVWIASTVWTVISAMVVQTARNVTIVLVLRAKSACVEYIGKIYSLPSLT